MFLRCTWWLPHIIQEGTCYGRLTVKVAPILHPFLYSHSWDMTLQPLLSKCWILSPLPGLGTCSSQQNMVEVRIASSELDSGGCVYIPALSQIPASACVEGEWLRETEWSQLRCPSWSLWQWQSPAGSAQPAVTDQLADLRGKACWDQKNLSAFPLTHMWNKHSLF